MYNRNQKVKKVKVLRLLKSETLKAGENTYLVSTPEGVFKLNEHELFYYQNDSWSLDRLIEPHRSYYQVVGNMTMGEYRIIKINPDITTHVYMGIHECVMFESFNYDEALKELNKLKADAEASAFRF